MQGRSDSASFVSAFSGSHRYIVDYLTEEVLGQQPEHIRTFLLQTSMLDRLNGSLCDALANTLNLRVIALDRPGMGRSDFQQGRTFGDWPADVTALANGLNMEHFAVFGCSGGGPYAVACALHIPERLTSDGISPDSRRP